MAEATRFILYACPVGPLAQQIDAYLEQAAVLCGPNKAHQYMPHCTLTGFFEDEPATAATYVTVLDGLLAEPQRSRVQPDVIIKAMLFKPEWHGLELVSPWLHQLALGFRDRAESTTLQSPIRSKNWLHLSLAYGFAPDHSDRLQQLAETHIDLASPVSWELRFYERRPDNDWICHQSWPLSTYS